ncbi:hypothetical protein lerEdw1_018012 [Lerista edwardsae]|nr:hypothetical protein lerEdw1_018012 [Lerista edwardsae]
MSTGSLSDAEVEMLECDAAAAAAGLKVDRGSPLPPPARQRDEVGSPAKGRQGGAGKRKRAPGKKSPLNGLGHEGKQVQRNAANARERARMRVLSKAFSRLKTTLPWVPPDTKLSKLDTLRLASSYIAHLRQILASDKYENGYIHPVNLVSGQRAAGLEGWRGQRARAGHHHRAPPGSGANRRGSPQARARQTWTGTGVESAERSQAAPALSQAVRCAGQAVSPRSPGMAGALAEATDGTEHSPGYAPPS